MRLGLLQLNYRVGDVAGNAAKIVAAVQAAPKVDLFVTSELALMGYPPKDLLFNYGLLEKCQKELESLALSLKDYPPILVGAPKFNDTGVGKALFNASFLLQKGRVDASFHKKLLPTYDVFDEARYFESAKSSQILELGGRRIGITICEDIWNDHLFQPAKSLYGQNPMNELRAGRVDLVVNLSSSPFWLGKHKQRETMLSMVAKKSGVPLVYVNQVGGNDDLIFDGRTLAFNHAGEQIAQGAMFAEDFVLVDTDSNVPLPPAIVDEEKELFMALVLGTRDYVEKCGFKKVVLGLSGGIDSALTAVIAAQALGPDKVKAILLPSPYSSKGSIDDSLNLAKRVGIETAILPIGDLMQGFEQALTPVLGGQPTGLTAENLQARIRGNLLMAYSNQTNAMLLTTGNKSELSVGYCTIYGDMAGGLAVISDLPKTLVYRLSNWINQTQNNPIPQAIIDKAPSAELRPNQTDQDSLPPYEQLDAILSLYIEGRRSLAEIVEAGFAEPIVQQIAKLVRGAEFKRKQLPPGLKVHELAFGTGWRMPIAAKSL